MLQQEKPEEASSAPFVTEVMCNKIEGEPITVAAMISMGFCLLTAVISDSDIDDNVDDRTGALVLSFVFLWFYIAY